MELIHENWHIGPNAPIRAITIGVSHLMPAAETVEQVDMFDLLAENQSSSQTRDRHDKLVAAMDAIRRKSGREDSVTLGIRNDRGIGLKR